MLWTVGSPLTRSALLLGAIALLGTAGAGPVAAQSADPAEASSEPGMNQTGPLAVTGAWARISHMVDRAGAAFMVITNSGMTDDALVAASTDLAGVVELHQSRMAEDGMMTMVKVDSIPVPAGGEAVLKPGDYHVMLIDLVAPLEEGMVFDLVLDFRSGASLTVPVTVSADMPDGGMHGPGSIAVTGAWARISHMVDRAGAAFMVITNSGMTDDALVAASTDLAGVVELHQSRMAEDGMMTMVKVDSIPVPAGGEAVLKPGDYHVMLIDLVAPLEEGMVFDLVLDFRSGASLTVPVTVSADMPME